MIVITYAYTPENENMRQMRLSVERQGYELAVVKTSDAPHQIMKDLYECYKRAATGHEYMVYADHPDTFFQTPLPEMAPDMIIYSTEKACFPYKEKASKFNAWGRWIYLNNGLFAGPTKLVIEFFDRYNLHSLAPGVNGQAAVQDAYLDAEEKGFPIELDTACQAFQSIAFEDPDEFEMKDGLLHNRITGTVPAVIHGNGLTPMEWIYKTVEK
jgi:hypothetical protein